MRSSVNRQFALPIIPPYRDGELVQAHLRRIADANHISAPQLVRILVSETELLEEKDRRELIESLARQLGHPKALVEALTYTGYLIKSSAKSSRRQVCPECLRQDNTSSALLAEPAYAICPSHGLAHLIRCPKCQRGLSWDAGDYFHCSCGFDLRFADQVKVNQETIELLRACLENRSPMDSQTTMAVDTVAILMDRFKTSLEYLRADQCRLNASYKSPFISDEAFQWDAIGRLANDCQIGLDNVVTNIETRMIFSKAKPGWAISRFERVRAAISWAHLRDLAMAAQRKVIDVEQPIDVASVAEIYGLDSKDVLAVQLQVNEAIALPLRSELRAQLTKLKRKNGDAPERDKQKLVALIRLTQDLRSIHQPDWLKHFPIDGQIELLTFIAAGALQPWAAVQIENWHVFKGDFAKILQRIDVRPWPDPDPNNGEFPFGEEFRHVFSSSVAPSAWMGLSVGEIEKRVTALIRRCEWSVSRFDPLRDQLALPLGFCAFMSDGPLMVCCDARKERKLENYGLACLSWETAVYELVQVCLRAQANYVRLSELQRMVADVAWKYGCGLKSGAPKVLIVATANAEIAKFEPHPHKAFCAAIKAAIEVGANGTASMEINLRHSELLMNFESTV